MTDNLQQLLDEEAHLKNSRQDATHIEKLIRELRDSKAPGCFGEDDCSTLILSQCPWRIDCGIDQTVNDVQAVAGGLSQIPLD